MNVARLLTGVCNLLPGTCALCAGIGFAANVALALLGAVEVPTTAAQGRLLHLYFGLWGNAPLLLIGALAGFLIGRQTLARRRWAVYSGLCSAFWLCPPLFVM